MAHWGMGLGMTYIKRIYLKNTLLKFSGKESKFQIHLHNAYSQMEIIQGKGWTFDNPSTSKRQGLDQ